MNDPELTSICLSTDTKDRILNLYALISHFAPLSDEGISAKVDGKKYRISFEDISNIKEFIDSSFLDPHKALIMFNRIRHIATIVLSDLENTEGNRSENAQKAMELLYLIHKFEKAAETNEKGFLLAGDSVEFTVTKRDLARMKRAIIVGLQKSEIPSFDWIVQTIQFNGQPLTEEETIFMGFFISKLPNMNKALLAYELLEKRTKKLNPANNDHFRRQIVSVHGEKFQSYVINEWESPLMIHSVGLNEWGLKKLDLIQSGDFNSSLCVSIIEEDSVFFNHGCSLGFVLAANPGTIVATNSHDIQSPPINVSETSRTLSQGEDFHNFYKKISLVTSYIDMIYRTSGLSLGQTDDYSRFLRLQSLRQSLQSQPADDAVIQELALIVEEILVIKQKHLGSGMFSKGYDLYEGLPFFQLNTLIEHYSNMHPEDEASEFFKIFGRQGSGIVQELQKSLGFLKSFQNEPEMFRFYFNTVQSPREILAKTSKGGGEGFPWNEINLDLRQKPGMTGNGAEVKALIINQSTLDREKTNRSNKLLEMFKKAKSLNIPILIRAC